MSKREAANLAILSRKEKQELLRQLIQKQKLRPQGSPVESSRQHEIAEEIPESFYRIERFPSYELLQVQRSIAGQLGLDDPFFRVHEGIAADTTRIDGRELINFCTYSYVGLNGDSRVLEAAVQAARQYGTSASASRLVSGERPPHRELERALAAFLGTEDCLLFVSGHTTNVSTLSAIAGPRDLILHDRLIHNSVLQGALASGAQRLSFPHNNLEALEDILRERRRLYEKVLIVVEGIYSMDGDMAPLPELVRIKTRHKAILMIDEAHSLGVAGSTGRGITEHFNISSRQVDIVMGTLSKTLVGCGGYIAGSRALVELLKFTASGFVYSVGMPPPMAAASRAALEILIAEPQRVRKLQENGRHFLATAGALHLNTGYSEGHNIVPIIVGSSLLAGRVSDALFKRGINVQPIIYPAVEERAARLRFFLSSEHSFEQIEQALHATAEELAAARPAQAQA